MGGSVGELLQVGIGTGQFFRMTLTFKFRRPARINVALVHDHALYFQVNPEIGNGILHLGSCRFRGVPRVPLD